MPTYRVNGMWVHMRLSGPKRNHAKPCRASTQRDVEDHDEEPPAGGKLIDFPR